MIEWGGDDYDHELVDDDDGEDCVDDDGGDNEMMIPSATSV